MDTSNFPESASLQRRKYSKIELSKNHTGTWRERERVGERGERESAWASVCKSKCECECVLIASVCAYVFSDNWASNSKCVCGCVCERERWQLIFSSFSSLMMVLFIILNPLLQHHTVKHWHSDDERYYLALLMSNKALNCRNIYVALCDFTKQNLCSL